jgi:acyl carrier protein
MEQIEQELRQFVVDNFLFGEGEGQFSNEDSFLEKGLVDSMGILTLVNFVQEKYAIAIADEELVPDNWDSVRRIAAFVQGKLSVTK